MCRIIEDIRIPRGCPRCVPVLDKIASCTDGQNPRRISCETTPRKGAKSRGEFQASSPDSYTLIKSKTGSISNEPHTSLGSWKQSRLGNSSEKKTREGRRVTRMYYVEACYGLIIRGYILNRTDNKSLKTCELSYSDIHVLQTHEEIRQSKQLTINKRVKR